MPDYLISQVFSLARSGTVMNYEIKRERRAFFFFFAALFLLGLHNSAQNICNFPDRLMLSGSK